MTRVFRNACSDIRCIAEAGLLCLAVATIGFLSSRRRIINHAVRAASVRFVVSTVVGTLAALFVRLLFVVVSHDIPGVFSVCRYRA